MGQIRIGKRHGLILPDVLSRVKMRGWVGEVRIGNRHGVTGEGNHFGSLADVEVVERRPFGLFRLGGGSGSGGGGRGGEGAIGGGGEGGGGGAWQQTTRQHAGSAYGHRRRHFFIDTSIVLFIQNMIYV